MTPALHVAAFFIICGALALAAEEIAPGSNPVEVASRQFLDGKLDAALATLDGAERQGARSGRSLDLRGCILMEQGKFDEAIKSLEAAGEAEPVLYARLHIGDALRRQGKWEEARAAYQEGRSKIHSCSRSVWSRQKPTSLSS